MNNGCKNKGRTVKQHTQTYNHVFPMNTEGMVTFYQANNVWLITTNETKNNRSYFEKHVLLYVIRGQSMG